MLSEEERLERKRIASKKHYYRNREAIIAKQLAWHAEHPEYRKEYYRKNKEKMIAAQKEYQKKLTAEQNRLRSKKFRERYKEKHGIGYFAHLRIRKLAAKAEKETLKARLDNDREQERLSASAGCDGRAKLCAEVLTES